MTDEIWVAAWVKNIMKMKADFNKLKGFTLIEVMIAVVIVAILAAVALPSYRNHVQRSNRAVAKAILLENVQFMEQFFTVNNSYAAAVIPITQSPRTGVAQYTIALNPVAAATFTLQAVPTGTMAGDVCGTFTLTNMGVQGATGGNVAGCWNR